MLARVLLMALLASNRHDSHTYVHMFIGTNNEILKVKVFFVFIPTNLYVSAKQQQQQQQQQQ
jgi:hypothetical protein